MSKVTGYFKIVGEKRGSIMLPSFFFNGTDGDSVRLAWSAAKQSVAFGEDARIAVFGMPDLEGPWFNQTVSVDKPVLSEVLDDEEAA